MGQKEKLAVKGGKPINKKPFPKWPVWDEKDLLSINEAICSGSWDIRSGSKILEFEKKYAEFQHVDHVISCANGSVAIEAVLEALDIGPGDEVIVPDYTFMATASAPMRCGAKIRIVDTDPDTFCISSEAIEDAINENTKAIIPVHIGGQPCDMDKIMGIAEKHNLFVIEDSAQAHGAKFKSQGEVKFVGSSGMAGTFSCQASKTLNCGEGGIIVTNDEELARKCRIIVDAGRVEGKSVYYHKYAGTNYRINEIQGALLLSQLERLEDQSNLRDENGKLLTEKLSKIDNVKPQLRPVSLVRHGYFLFTFLLLGNLDRDLFRKALEAEGIPTLLSYPAIHTLDFINKNEVSHEQYKNSNLLDERAVWLPQRLLLAEKDQILLIAEAVKKIMENTEDLVSPST